MNTFTFPFSLFCSTMILPVICVGGRVVKCFSSKNYFGVNIANKQNKCALNYILV